MAIWAAAAITTVCISNISDLLVTQSSKQHGCSCNSSKTTYLKYYCLKTVHYLLSCATSFPVCLLFSCVLSSSADWQLTQQLAHYCSGWKQMCICPINKKFQYKLGLNMNITKLLCNLDNYKDGFLLTLKVLVRYSLSVGVYKGNFSSVKDIHKAVKLWVSNQLWICLKWSISITAVQSFRTLFFL